MGYASWLIEKFDMLQYGSELGGYAVSVNQTEKQTTYFYLG